MTPEQFRSLARLLPEPSFLISMQGNILSANRAADIIVGKSREDLSECKVADFASTPESELNEFLRMCSSSSERIVGAITFRLSDASELPFRCDGGLLQRSCESEHATIFLRCTPRHNASSGFVALNEKIDELNKEIRERKRTEAALRRSENLLSGVIENATAVIYIKSIQGKYIFVNRHYEELFNTKLNEVLGKTDFDFFPAEAAEILRINDANVVNSGSEFRCEEIIPLEDGNHTYLSIKFPLFNENDELYAVCGVSTDITPMKQAEEKIKSFNKELETQVNRRTEELVLANRELESFSYSVSHDLRAPLRGIDGFSQALMEDYSAQLDDTGKDYLARIRAGSQQMGHLIDSLLQLSRITRTEPKPKTVNLSDIASKVIDSLYSSDSNRDVEIKIQMGVQVIGDEKLLHVVLENLLGNAWKFTGKTPHATIEFGQTSDNHDPVIYVRDNGAGFDMHYVEKLFNPFQRLHSSNEFEGTGIGLATVNRIIQRHRGRIWADSKVGQGSTFWFTLNETDCASRTEYKENYVTGT